MTQAVDLVLQAKAMGISFRIDGEHVIICSPKARREELALIIGALRQHKEDVKNLLQSQSARRTIAVEVLGQSLQYEVESLMHPNPSLVIIFVNGCKHIVHHSLEGPPFAAKEHAVICENRSFKPGF